MVGESKNDLLFLFFWGDYFISQYSSLHEPGFHGTRWKPSGFFDTNEGFLMFFLVDQKRMDLMNVVVSQVKSLEVLGRFYS